MSLTVSQYHSIDDLDYPVELLAGVLVRKAAKKAPHRIATRATRRALVTRAQPKLRWSWRSPTLLSARDRGVKSRIYARSRIPVYWIMDLNAAIVEVRTDPAGDGYRLAPFHTRTQAVPVIIDRIEVGSIPVSRLLPPL